MKYILLGLGLLLILLALVSLGQYVFDYGDLSSYGKGFIWGKVLILSLGIILTYLGIRKKKAV